MKRLPTNMELLKLSLKSMLFRKTSPSELKIRKAFSRNSSGYSTDVPVAVKKTRVRHATEKDVYPLCFNVIAKPHDPRRLQSPRLKSQQCRQYTPPPPYHFTSEELAFSLYEKSVVQPIDTERIQRKRRNNCQYWSGDAKRRYFTTSNQHSDRIDISPSNAIMTFLPEVQLCISSLPGFELGVCARREIPKDTVIGPYKGRRITQEEVKMRNGVNVSYLWEIFKCGKLDHYLDGSDEKVSCWMRFILSARNKEEQNLCAIQHGENIFYKTIKDIPVGAELLVWYENRYMDYFGIPIGLHNDNPKLSQEATRNQRKLAYHSLRREPFTAEILKTMERTRLWVDERLGMNSSLDLDETEHSRLQRRDSNDDDSSFPSSNNSDGDTRCTTPDDTDPNMWRCNQCQQSFNQRSALRIHECSMQTNQPFDCGHCSLSFADPNELRNHVGTHTNDRLFKCGYCGRRFAGATTLTNHIRTHTGEKPFSCEKCGKNFSQASQINRHQKIPGDCVQ